MLNVPDCIEYCSTCICQGGCLAGRDDDYYVRISFDEAKSRIISGDIKPDKDLIILYPQLSKFISMNLLNMNILYTFNTNDILDYKELDRRIPHNRLKYTLKGLVSNQDLLKEFIGFSKNKYTPITKENYDLIMSTISSHALIITNINELNNVLENVEITKYNKLKNIPIYILIIKNIETNKYGKVSGNIDLLKIDKHQATYRQKNMINMYIKLNKQVEELNEIRNKKL